MNKLAKQFLEKLNSSSKQNAKVTTVIEGEVLDIVEKYRRGQSIKSTIAELIKIADAELSKEEKDSKQQPQQ